MWFLLFVSVETAEEGRRTSLDDMAAFEKVEGALLLAQLEDFSRIFSTVDSLIVLCLMMIDEADIRVSCSLIITLVF